jgi:hypothetical protein
MKGTFQVHLQPSDNLPTGHSEMSLDRLENFLAGL